jgi:hypothetical protein
MIYRDDAIGDLDRGASRSAEDVGLLGGYLELTRPAIRHHFIYEHSFHLTTM